MRPVRYLILFLALFAVTGWGAEPAVPGLDERIREKDLDNGLKIVVVERHVTPTFFSLVTFRVGSTSEQPNHSGLSHFLEHMLFKGTEKIGSTDYAAEMKVMNRLEAVAIELKNRQIAIKPWRFDQFEQYALDVKVNLPDSVRDAIGADEAKIWRAVLDHLPVATDSLPADWRRSPWMLNDGKLDYWGEYRKLLALRSEMWDLSAEQKKYIPASEPYDGIYDVLGAQGFNAGTTDDLTEYENGLPSNCLERWMYLEADRFQHPVFREFYTEKAVVLEELRERSADPWSALSHELSDVAFQAHPYGRPVIGWPEDVFLTVRSDMQAHFDRYYAPNNCQITLVGDVRADSVFAYADKFWSSWKRGQPVEEVTVTEPEQNGERRCALEFDAEPQLMIAYHAPVAPHPDYYPLRMADMVLSSGRTSRFYKSIFMDQQLTEDSPGSGAPSGRYDETFNLYATPKAPHTVAEVEAALYAELDKLKNEPVSQRELDRARNKFRIWQMERLRSNDNLAYTLSEAFTERGDWRTITEDFERLMAVTPADIQRVAKTYFIPRNRTVAYIVKKSDGAAELETDNGDQK